VRNQRADRVAELESQELAADGVAGAKRRIRRVFGQLDDGELSAIDRGLEPFLGLDPQ